MPIHNSDIAEAFNKIADFLEIKGENVFRVRAYRNAALVIAGFTRSAADMVKDGEDLILIANRPVQTNDVQTWRGLWEN